ncbi:cytochrome P450 [Nocardiopsis changdeensis]|uniref:Cytochrome P450 n=1 Tax=Nocardiopsis changdeensis TaxID=2831969 RepID=A0ABX8BS64_9ACTN|nr:MULTISPECIES: cytochrome P450 [Nocardiopsis]QUX25085.1 cytochrome P450 [Nocardiopsis changdeensis]QYX35471.1 cytochrome P450 [Nocardiopsis sp. MT53]
MTSPVPDAPDAPDTTADGAPAAFPLARSCPFSPPDGYAPMREKGGLTKAVIPSGKEVWLVTGFQDVRTALSHPAAGSDARHPAFPALGDGEQAVAAELRPFIRMDPPEHTRIRRMLVGEFTVKRVRAMRPAVEAICREQADRLLSLPAPADLVGEYANRVSTTVICRLLGVPMEDLEFFRRITSVSGARTSTAEEVGAALSDLFGLIDRLIDEKAQEPGDDLISRLVNGPLARGEITRTSLLSQIGITLNAGHETSRNMIPLAALDLLRHPDQLDLLREDPSLWPGAVDELLRHLSVADVITLRVATGDIPLEGATIPAGDGFIALLAAADHDPRAFPDPGRLDITRAQRNHVAFGYGAHQCVGQNLGRLEIEVALRVLFEKAPGLRLAVPLEDLPLRSTSAIFGLDEVPVSW